MTRILILLALALAARVDAQTVTAARFTLTTGPCTERSGSGAPASGLGVVCDTYTRTDSPYTVYQKVGASTWVEMHPASGTTGDLFYGSSATAFGRLAAVGTGQVLASAGTSTAPAYTATPTVTTLTGSTSVVTPTLTNSGNLTLSPTGDVVFNPTGNDLLPTTGYDLNIGSLTAKYLTLHAAELWVETLVAQDTIATIGGRVLVGPTTTLTADLTSVATSIQTKHNQLASGDRVLLHANGAVEWLAVTGAPGGSAGAYTYTVTRDLDGTGANAWTAGDAVFNTGASGDGFIDLYSIGAVTPPKFQYIYNFNASGSVYSSNYAEALQFEFLGDNSFDGVNDAIYFGAPSTFLTFTTEGMTSCAAGTATTVWEYWNGSAWTSFSPTGTACTAGHNAVVWTSLSGWATTTVNSVSAFWIRFRLTNTPGTPWTPSVVKNVARAAQQWGPTVVGNVRTGTTFSDIEARWAIGNLNGLYGYSADTYGTAFGSPSAAWVKIDPTNGVRLGHNSTTSAQISASGAASFVTGNVTLDTTGIRISPDTAAAEPIDLGNSYSFSVTGTDAIMGLYGSDEAAGQTMVLQNYAEAGDTAGINIVTQGASVLLSNAGTIGLVASTGTSAVNFLGVSGSPDLSIYTNNGTTTANPYTRSDGNTLSIESRSAANSGSLNLNGDQVANVFTAFGGGSTYLNNPRFATAPLWESGLAQTTVGAAGGASALPATPTVYVKVNYAGTAYVIPAYTP